MSLSLALSSSLSGLKLSSRATQVVADNVANAQTENYGVRVLTQASRVLGNSGSGVVSTGIRRDLDTVLLGDLRNAHADKLSADLKSDFWSRMENAIGHPGEPDSLSARIDMLDAALLRATSDPSSTALLTNVVQAANDISQQFRTMHALLQSQRDIADHAIAREVEMLNLNLQKISDLNSQIQRQTLTGGAPEALIDERQRLINQVAEVVSITEVPRENGRVMLIGQGGFILVDTGAETFGFVRTPLPEAHYSLASGDLSPVTLAGRNLSETSALLSAGRLGAHLEIRDHAAPEVQQKLDRLAFDLAERFMQPGIDPSLPPGAFGLFLLEGAVALPADPIANAGLLRTNPTVDPEQGGELFRLRDGIGLGAPAVGMEHDNSLLAQLRMVLRDALPIPGHGANRSVAGHVAEVTSALAIRRLGFDQQSVGHSARFAALSESFAAQGVDTDAELSRLLVLEQSYAANARVISTIDAMFRSLMEI